MNLGGDSSVEPATLRLTVAKPVTTAGRFGTARRFPDLPRSPQTTLGDYQNGSANSAGAHLGEPREQTYTLLMASAPPWSFTTADIPPRDASWEEVCACSGLAYDLQPDLARGEHRMAAIRVWDEWTATGRMPTDLRELRLTLCALARRYNWDLGTRAAEDAELEMAHRVIDAIWDMLDQEPTFPRIGPASAGLLSAHAATFRSSSSVECLGKGGLHAQTHSMTTA